MDGFSRVTEQAVRSMAAAGLQTASLVMILIMRYQKEDENGRLYGSFPRARMAEILDCSENTVKKATRRLLQSGLISVREPGRNGKATSYWIMPSLVSTPEESYGCTGGTGNTPNPSVGGTVGPLKGVPGVPPIRKNRGGGAKPPLSQRELKSTKAWNGCTALAPLAADEPEGDEDDFVFKMLGLDEGSRWEVSYA